MDPVDWAVKYSPQYPNVYRKDRASSSHFIFNFSDQIYQHNYEFRPLNYNEKFQYLNGFHSSCFQEEVNSFVDSSALYLEKWRKLT